MAQPIPVHTACCLLLAAAISAGTATAQNRADKREAALLRALDQWTASYRAGKVDLRGRRDQSGGAILARAGLVDPDSDFPLTPLRELQLLLDGAAKAGTPATILRVTRLAGVGLGHHRWGPRHAAALVRAMAERSLGAFVSATARARVLAIARGDKGAADGDDAEEGTRAAALRALGRFGDPPAQRALVAALAHAEPAVRLAAADGLRQLNREDCAAPLIDQIGAETVEAPLIAASQALRDVFQRHQATLATRELRRGVRTVVTALGRTGWRGDLALVRFLQDFRATAAIPALIDLLELRHDNGLLRAVAYELLRDLTGAMFPADDVAAWRAFWQREGGGFRLAKRRPAAEDGAGNTVAGGFFGIVPVGSRVVFVIDVSGSMREPAPFGRTEDRGATKLDLAKRELRRAVEGLASESRFNIVLFSEQVQAWRNDLVPADAANKRAAERFVDRLRPQTATNLWGGLDRALRIESLVYGDRYASNVDELFLLSDGAPTAGEVVSPTEILRTIHETNRFSGVRINTVFIGTVAGRGLMPAGMQPPVEGWMDPAELMAALAHGNDGQAVVPR